MTDNEKKVSRRGYIAGGAAVAAAAVVGGAAWWYYYGQPQPSPTPTPTKSPTPTPTKSPTPTPTISPEPTEINAIMLPEGGISYTGTIKRLVPEFEKDTGIKVTIAEFPMEDMTPKAITAFAAAQSPYDVFICNSTWQQPAWVAGGYLEPLNEYIEKDGWDEFDDYPWVTLANQCIYEKEPKSGKQGIRLDLKDVYPFDPNKHNMFGMIVDGDAMMSIIRKDWFEQAGRSPFETFDSILEYGEELTVDEQGLPLTDPNHGPTNRWALNLYMANTLGNIYLESLLPAWDARIVDNSFEPIPDDPKQIEIIEWMKDIWDMGIIPDASPSMGWAEQGEYFKAEKLASYTTWMVVTGQLLAEIPEQVPNMNFLPAPKKVYSSCGSAGWNAVIPKNTSKKDAAWEFCKWVSSTEVMKEIVKDTGGNHSSGRYSVMDDTTLPNHWVQQSFKTILEGTNAAWVIPEYGALRDQLSPILFHGVYEGVSASETLTTMNTAVKALLTGAGYYD